MPAEYLHLKHMAMLCPSINVKYRIEISKYRNIQYFSSSDATKIANINISIRVRIPIRVDVA